MGIVAITVNVPHGLLARGLNHDQRQHSQQDDHDGVYGGGTTGAPSPIRHNIKTGSQIPVHILAEADRKIDDGMPNTGSFQFSRYQGNAPTAPTDGTAVPPACTSATTAAGVWNVTNGSNNCGAASLL